jgi:hypothetical protein
MQHDYFVYVHEKDQYEIYILNELIRSASPHFIIDFDEAAGFFVFLNAIVDGLYPALVLVDLPDSKQVQTLVGELRRLHNLPTMPVWVLSDAANTPAYENTRLFERPRDGHGWEALSQHILQHMSDRYV